MPRFNNINNAGITGKETPQEPEEERGFFKSALSGFINWQTDLYTGQGIIGATQGLVNAGLGIYDTIDLLTFDALPDSENFEATRFADRTDLRIDALDELIRPVIEQGTEKFFGENLLAPIEEGSSLKGVADFAVNWGVALFGGGLATKAGKALNLGTKVAEKAPMLSKFAQTGVGKIMTLQGKEAILEAAFFRAQNENLSNMVEGTVLENPISDFLAASEDDSLAEGKLKLLLEGYLTGVGVDAVFAGISKFRKVSRMAQSRLVDDVREADLFAIGDAALDDFVEVEGATSLNKSPLPRLNSDFLFDDIFDDHSIKGYLICW